jgi:hypothetical protein
VIAGLQRSSEQSSSLSARTGVSIDAVTYLQPDPVAQMRSRRVRPDSVAGSCWHSPVCKPDRNKFLSSCLTHLQGQRCNFSATDGDLFAVQRQTAEPLGEAEDQ